MKANDIQNKIEETFKAMDAIKEVKVSPFFKHKTMQRLFAEKEAVRDILPWFSPKLQLATLVCFIFINVYAFLKISATTYEENVSDFADTYGLSIDTETNMFN